MITKMFSSFINLYKELKKQAKLMEEMSSIGDLFTSKEKNTIYCKNCDNKFTLSSGWVRRSDDPVDENGKIPWRKATPEDIPIFNCDKCSGVHGFASVGTTIPETLSRYYNLPKDTYIELDEVAISEYKKTLLQEDEVE